MAATAGYDGRRQLAVKDVVDPYDGEHLATVANIRESPLEHLFHRGVIDEAQKAAGDKFRAIYERSVIGGIQALDYRQPKVDGGALFDPMSESMHEASKTLRWISTVVGVRDYALLVKVAGIGLPIREAALDWQTVVVHRPGLANRLTPSVRTELYAGRRFRDALSVLAIEWGFAS